MFRRSLAGAIAAAAMLAGAGGADAQILNLDAETSSFARFDAASWADAAVIVGQLVENPAAAQAPAVFDPFADGLGGSGSGSSLWILGPDADAPPPGAAGGFELGRAYRAAAAAQDQPEVAAYDVEFNAGVLPEPASWGMMIVGFLGAGWLLRRHKQAMLAAWPTPAS